MKIISSGSPGEALRSRCRVQMGCPPNHPCGRRLDVDSIYDHSSRSADARSRRSTRELASIRRGGDVSPITDDVSQKQSEGTGHCDSTGLLLGDASLTASSARIGSLIAASAVGKPTLQLHGHVDKMRWQLQVTLPDQKHYIIVTQSDIICLGKNTHPYEDTLRLPFEQGVEWLLS